MADASGRARYAVVHGRFQPFHLGHLAYCRIALERAEILVVGITNFDPAMTTFETTSPHRHAPAANPFSYWERTLMIRDALLEDRVPAARFALTALPVHESGRWPHYVPTDPAESVHVLRVFSPWEEEKVRRLAAAGFRVEAIYDQQKLVSGSDVRARLAAGAGWEEFVPPAVHEWLMQLDATQRLRTLSASVT